MIDLTDLMKNQRKTKPYPRNRFTERQDLKNSSIDRRKRESKESGINWGDKNESKSNLVIRVRKRDLKKIGDTN